MTLSAFTPVLACASCGKVHAYWETRTISVKDEAAPRAPSRWTKVTAWWTDEYRFADATSIEVPIDRIAANLGRFCSACGAEPLTLRRVMARYKLGVLWNPLSWFGEREWVLGLNSAGATGGELSETAAPKETP